MNSGIFLTEISDNIFQIIRNFENIKKKKVRLYISVKNVIDIESKILKELSDNSMIYPNSDNIKGSYEELRNIIWKCVIEYDKPDNILITSTKIYKKKTDVIELFLEFIELNKLNYNNNIIKTTNIHQEFNIFLNINNSNMECKYNKLLSLLKQHYNVKIRSHEFEDGISQGICFPSLIRDQSNTSHESNIWSNPLENWLNTNYIVTKVQKDRITCEDLYKIYIKFSNRFITQKQFGQFMVILDHKSKSLHGIRYYVGLKSIIDTAPKNNSIIA